MRIDLHVHHRPNVTSTGADMVRNMNAAGIDKAVVLTEAPNVVVNGRLMSPTERIQRTMDFIGEEKDALLPFYFINPTEQDAVQQVDLAVEMGCVGFKIICRDHMPNDPRAIPTYYKIASVNKPLLFHSGILYDGNNASGNYNRPCNFEVLLSIPKLRFALAHISWPWTDECIAVFGKFQNYLSKAGSANAPEMFVDTTPGTPPRYRRDALAKLLDMHNAQDQIIWGTDCNTDYSTDYAQSIRTRDEGIYQELGLGKEFLDKLYYKNFMRFLTGKAD